MLHLQESPKQGSADRVARDISEHKLELAERVAHLGSWTWHIQTGQLEWSEEMLRIFGLEPGAPRLELQRVMATLVHPDDRAAVEELNRKIVEGCRPGALEYQIQRPDGTVRVICCEVGELIRDAQGRLITALGIVQDVTERREAHETLLDSQAKLRAALASMSDAVFVTDAAGHFVDFNDAFVSFHRFASRAECVENLPHYSRLLEAYGSEGDLLSPEDWPVSRALRGESASNSEYRLRRTDLGVAWVGSYSFAPIRDVAGRLVGSVGVARDITELKRDEENRLKLEVELQQSQKMESIGQLAGGVAHDFNNMLAVILGHVEMAMQTVPSGLPLHDDLEQIQSAARRSADLTKQLLAFARQQTAVPRVLLLDETLSGMTKMLQRLIGENVELVMKTAAGLWPVRVDPSQIDQVLANLCLNARDAITGVGKITVELSNATLSLPDCAALPGVSPGEYVQLVVRDTGHGMDEAVLSHLFEPFFTTKTVGRGTGLGLATVYGIIKQNRGFISIRSTQGVGSEFTIYLPRHTGAPDAAEPPPRSASIVGHEVVLLVEDEPGILGVTKRLLEQLGYFVLAAGGTSEAISLARNHAGKIDLILTDVVMPEMNGRDLANVVETHHPRIKRLFMSGHTRGLIADQGVLDRGINFLQKPFTRDALGSKLRTVLEC